MNKVENLKKVTLALEIGTTADRMDLTSEPIEFDFIFGIGPAGMCPFEYRLVEKAENEIVLLNLKKEEIDEFTGHLQLPVLDPFTEHASLFIKITIIRIEQPDAKEMVKALAGLTSHAEGCGCGCGC